MRIGTRADLGETDFSNTLSAGRQQGTKTKNKKKGGEYEKTNAYEPHHPFKPRIGLSPSHLVSSPSAIRRACGGEEEMKGKMMERCQEIKEQKQKMMEDMKAQDAELTAQVAGMNSAPEDKKMSQMAVVITHMVEQRIAMDARKAKMEEEMMKHMMEPMKMGKESMSQCPMMKGIKGMEDQSGDAHKRHQKK